MNNSSPELKEFLSCLEQGEKMTAMLAPSFPIDFRYPRIVGKLKRLGFSYVVEVARGAAETNKQLLKLVKDNPRGRYITSPCPSVVRLIRTKYPHLIRYLAKIDSPMMATAKLVLKKFPGTRPVFIGPCLAKKAEAKEDWPDLRIIVLTYKEVVGVFKMKEIKDDPDDGLAAFDEVGPQTRLYPISGGLTQSAGLVDLLTDEELDVISGPKLAEEMIKEFLHSKLRILDILYCEGGCISGSGINSRDSLDRRRQRVLVYWAH